MASSLRSFHFSTMAKKAAIAGGDRRARVAGSARSGSLRRSSPRSGTMAKAFIGLLQYWIRLYTFMEYCQERFIDVKYLMAEKMRARSLPSPEKRLRSG